MSVVTSRVVQTHGILYIFTHVLDGCVSINAVFEYLHIFTGLVVAVVELIV